MQLILLFQLKISGCLLFNLSMRLGRWWIKRSAGDSLLSVRSIVSVISIIAAVVES